MLWVSWKRKVRLERLRRELWALVRGGGDLASGAILRLARVGVKVIVTELAQPLMVRRKVSFAEAIYQGVIEIEGIRGIRTEIDFDQIIRVANNGQIPVIIDPDLEIHKTFSPDILVDGRMLKQLLEDQRPLASLVIGLGPGFIAGTNCHAVVETKRGHFLGRVIWEGAAEKDSGIPEGVDGKYGERVIRAPCTGVFSANVEIGDFVVEGQRLGNVGNIPVNAPFDGVVRGLIWSGLQVYSGQKIGDVDPRGDPRYCWFVSDKSLAVGGGVLEAVLTMPEFRSRLG